MSLKISPLLGEINIGKKQTNTNKQNPQNLFEKKKKKHTEIQFLHGALTLLSIISPETLLNRKI